MPTLDERLVVALRDVDFDSHYYEFVDRIRNRTSPSGLQKPHWHEALANTGIDFRYHSKEQFFSTERRIGECIAAFDITFRHDEMGLGVNVITPNGRVGGPFTRLARDAGLLRDPSFSPVPRSPTFPFSNAEQLREAIEFAVTLFDDFEEALIASKICEGSK